ncbi:hypothetical protein CSKR_114151 [Clonorchis sinensis]|uniref:Uncharacterized protein n=1 Tax=Clonorchis sinensis TaxID=79923 RepID=A0A3R7FHK8_CLOSI|nr:hypothetical protein CSKR_114151 [Clonorchis sinensis]
MSKVAAGASFAADQSIFRGPILAASLVAFAQLLKRVFSAAKLPRSVSSPAASATSSKSSRKLFCLPLLATPISTEDVPSGTCVLACVSVCKCAQLIYLRMHVRIPDCRTYAALEVPYREPQQSHLHLNDLLIHMERL